MAVLILHTLYWPVQLMLTFLTSAFILMPSHGDAKLFLTYAANRVSHYLRQML